MRTLLLIALLSALALTGCQVFPFLSGASAPEAAAPSAEAPAMAESDTSDIMARPAWHSLALTNARTGAAFTLADFTGQTVLVEPMATWCSNCRAQLGNATRAAEQLASQPVVFVALSVAENISDADLAAYAERQGFPFIFAVATPEMLAALTANFGRAAITPPSTPHFIIAPDGSVSSLFTGSKSAADLVSLLSAQGA
mgnify:CR=1 FL=1